MLTPQQIKAIDSNTGGVNRLRSWVREFGDTVMPIFRDDVLEAVKAVDDLIETVCELQGIAKVADEMIESLNKANCEYGDTIEKLQAEADQHRRKEDELRFFITSWSDECEYYLKECDRLRVENRALRASLLQQQHVAIQVNDRGDMLPIPFSDKVTDCMRSE